MLLSIKYVLQFWFSVLLPRAVVADETDQGEKVVGAAGVLLHLLVDPLRYVGRQDLHQGGGGQSPHGVVLDGSSRQVSVRHKGKVVNSPVRVSVSTPRPCLALVSSHLMSVPRFSL